MVGESEQDRKPRSSALAIGLMAGGGITLCLLATGLLALGGWYLLAQEKEWLEPVAVEGGENPAEATDEPGVLPANQPLEPGTGGGDSSHGTETTTAPPNVGSIPSTNTSIPYQRVQDLKDATVYLKVTKGPLNSTGSGFVMLTEGDAGYVVTNAHVIDPRADVVFNVPPQMGPRPSGPRRANPRSAVPLPSPPENAGPRQIVRSVGSTASAKVTLVFRSGTRKETHLSGEIVCADHLEDLAILKFKGLTAVPHPINFMQTPKPVETMTIYVFGFPFGQALALNNSNPPVTVGKGTVSSVRLDDRDALTGIQIDGAINPGNSGGPVVDPEGRLVGIAARTIRGSGIGLAIPTDKLIRMLNGRIGDFKLASKGPGADGLLIEAKANLFDPRKYIKDVSINYLPRASYKTALKPRRDGTWPALPGASNSVLARNRESVSGTFTVRPADGAEVDLVVQSSFVTTDGRTFCGEPQSQRIASPLPKADKTPTAPSSLAAPKAERKPGS